MSGRLQLIEQKLLAIDGATFQNLCDTYLSLREDEYSSLNRSGSQLGKQKTVVGTPDTFLRVSDNKLAYVEFTTQATSIVSKVSEDIDKCLDESKTGVSPKQVHKIIICLNHRLSVKEETKIFEYANDRNTGLELIGIDTLALEIMSKYLLLAREYLGIAMETGQILPFEKFISEYNNKANQLSTPIDNVFFHRSTELKQIEDALSNKDLLILSGAPGVGKTKIGIEAIQNFKQKNPSFESYVIAKKDVDIFEDLKIQLRPDKDYILLIDDANRQLPNLKQIFGIFKENRSGQLKLVITVRNYALIDIKACSIEFVSETIDIPKFTDEEITEILKSDSFGIINHKYQKKIVEISNGNPRLAIMGARVALEKQSDFLFGDVADLFETYFSSFSMDFNLFEKPELLKTLGLVSFFFTIDREDKGKIENILSIFQMDYYQFNEAIEDLHKRELVEVQYNHVRISEQVMATYIFYIVFIRDGLMSFEKLLFNYFDSHKFSFKEALYPSSNSFGYNNVFTKINPQFDKYIEAVRNSEEKLLKFLDLFWFSKPDETLSYFLSKINAIEEPLNPLYDTHYETNDFVHKKEQIIDYLSRFFVQETESFIPAIQLGFEFIRKKPEHLPEFIRRVRENLIFDEPDERYGFHRQAMFIDHLHENIQNGKIHYSVAFFALAESFLKHSHHMTKGARKNAISIYDYPIPATDEIRQIRTKIWETLFSLISNYRDNVVGTIQKYKPDYRERNPEILDFDLTLLVPFIKKNFSPTSFVETFVVNGLIASLDRESKITNKEYLELKPMFNTQEYRDYRKLDWNRFRDKEEYEFDNWREYEEIKSKDLKENFTFESRVDFKLFLDTVDNYQSVKDSSHSQIENSLEVILSENFNKNTENGLYFLEEYLKKNYSIRCLYRTIASVAKHSEQSALKFWNILEETKNKDSILWKIAFLDRLPSAFANDFYFDKLIETINSINGFMYLYIEQYDKFSKENCNAPKKVLESVHSKIKTESQQIRLSEYPFKEKLEIFENDYTLIKESYFQQYALAKSSVSFDYQLEGFANIYKNHQEFLFDFFENFYSNYNAYGSNENLNLSFIWDYPDRLNEIKKVIDFLVKRDLYISLGGHSVSILFNDLNEVKLGIALNFIQNIIKENQGDRAYIEIIFDTIRTNMQSKHDELFLYFLSLNSDVEFFKSVDWMGNPGVQMGNVIWGELHAKRWEKVLNILNTSKEQLRYIPIKNFIKKRIQSEYNRAESERIRYFITGERI
ncbi:nSTAND3 domain-containing NTPase [Galbibacter sp. BG1]